MSILIPTGSPQVHVTAANEDVVVFIATEGGAGAGIQLAASPGSGANNWTVFAANSPQQDNYAAALAANGMNPTAVINLVLTWVNQQLAARYHATVTTAPNPATDPLGAMQYALANSFKLTANADGTVTFGAK